MLRLALENGKEIHFKTACPDDIPQIINLYEKVYKGKYSLKEVADPEHILEKIQDPNYFWPLAQLGENIIGSVIFAIDPLGKIGKCYAAAVLNEFRGRDVMHTMVNHGLDRLTVRTRSCDVVYATTRTVSFAPQVVLEHIGFLPMGIFPNVRKVESFETHGLEVFYRKGSIESRRTPPRLIPEVKEFCKIACDVLNIPSKFEELKLPKEDPRDAGKPVKFVLEEDERELRRKFDSYQDKDLMDRVFFPFHEPNLLFSSEDGSAEIFVTFNKLDGNGVIVGYRISTPNLRNILMWFCEAAAQSGMRYIEMLVSAFRPDIQRLAIDARFLPCAYFPAMRMNDEGQREDYLIFSRSFENLDFMDMHLAATNRRFLDAFMKCWYEMLVRCQPDFDEEWRIG